MTIDELRKQINAKWNSLNGSEQRAAEIAIEELESNGISIKTIEDDDLEEYVSHSCNVISEGNAEPEYENEDWSEEEPNRYKVLEYLKLKRDYENQMNN